MNKLKKISALIKYEFINLRRGVLIWIISIVNILLAIVTGIMCKVTLAYFLYQIFGYVLNIIIFLIVCNALGLFIGQVICKEANEVVDFIVTIISFIALCNFYKLSNIIFPVIGIRTSPTYFDVISYDKSYLFHVLFWIIMSFILFLDE